GSLAVAGASACYGLSFTYLRRLVVSQSDDGVSLVAGQLLCGTAIMAVVTLAFTSAPSHLGAGPILSVCALGVLGTGVAYVLNYAVVRRAGATIASTVTYLVPLFAAACGVLLLGEGLDWNEPVGAFVVLLGVAISQGRLRLAPRRAPALRPRRAEVG